METSTCLNCICCQCSCEWCNHAGIRGVNQRAPDEELSNGRDDVRQNVKTAQFSRAERKQTSGRAKAAYWQYTIRCAEGRRAHTAAAHSRLLCVNAGLYLGMHGGGYYLHSLVFTCTCIHRIKHILFPEYILISVTVSRAPLQLLSNCVILMTFFSKDRRERVGSYLVMWQHKSTSNCSFVAVAAALENSV